MLTTTILILIFNILIFITVVYLIIYLIRKGLVSTLMQRLKGSHQQVLFEKTNIFLDNIDQELKISVSTLNETNNSLLGIKNEFHQLIDLINESNKIKQTETKEILLKLENIFLKNQTPNIKSLEKNIEEIYNNEVRKNIYYLPFPDVKGYFWDDKKSQDLQNNSAFLMELMKSDNKKAYFTFLTNKEKIIKNALLNPNAFLKPVCEITGNSNGSSITILGKGELILLNNKWTVLEGKKVKIKII